MAFCFLSFADPFFLPCFDLVSMFLRGPRSGFRCGNSRQLPVIFCALLFIFENIASSVYLRHEFLVLYGCASVSVVHPAEPTPYVAYRVGWIVRSYFQDVIIRWF